MKWVTREHPKTDRIACPWLIRTFIDPMRRSSISRPTTCSRSPSAKVQRASTPTASSPWPHWKTSEADRLVRLSPDPVSRLRPLGAAVGSTAAARRGANDPALQREVADRLRLAAADARDEEVRDLWLEMATALDQATDSV
jgi:hypothetical protein